MVKVGEDSILYHDIQDQLAICGTQDGNLYLVDLDKGESVFEGISVHDFSIWYTSFSKADCNIVYTGSDDSSFKKFDTRVGFQTPVYQNRKYHSAGVTFVR